MYFSPVGTRSENFQKNVFQIAFFFEAGEEGGRVVAAVTFCCDLEVFCPVFPPPAGAGTRRGSPFGMGTGFLAAAQHHSCYGLAWEPALVGWETELEKK